MKNKKNKGFKAIVKVLKASRKSYWYKNKKGKRYTVILVKDNLSKIGLSWQIFKDNKRGNGWIQIKDAEIIKWL